MLRVHSAIEISFVAESLVGGQIMFKPTNILLLVVAHSRYASLGKPPVSGFVAGGSLGSRWCGLTLTR